MSMFRYLVQSRIINSGFRHATIEWMNDSLFVSGITEVEARAIERTLDHYRARLGGKVGDQWAYDFVAPAEI